MTGALEAVLSRVDAKSTGGNQYAARCPVAGHGKGKGDRSRSLSIAEAEDGRVLLHCFGGCSVEEIVGSLGLELHDLFPARPVEHAKSIRRPFLPATVFEIVRLEIGIAAICAADLHANKIVSDSDYERLFLCVERLNDIAGAAYGR